MRRGKFAGCRLGPCGRPDVGRLDGADRADERPDRLLRLSTPPVGVHEQHGSGEHGGDGGCAVCFGDGDQRLQVLADERSPLNGDVSSPVACAR